MNVGQTDEFTLSVADAARLMRLQATLAAVVAELRVIPEGSIRTSRLCTMVQRLLGQADTVVPSALLAELHRLITAPAPCGETQRDLALLLVGLHAWLQGLAAQLRIVVRTRGVSTP
jgi:hypothetical protein